MHREWIPATFLGQMVHVDPFAKLSSKKGGTELHSFRLNICKVMQPRLKSTQNVTASTSPGK